MPQVRYRGSLRCMSSHCRAAPVSIIPAKSKWQLHPYPHPNGDPHSLTSDRCKNIEDNSSEHRSTLLLTLYGTDKSTTEVAGFPFPKPAGSNSSCQLEIAYSASLATSLQKMEPWGRTWSSALCTICAYHFDPRQALLFSFVSKPHLHKATELFSGRMHHIEWSYIININFSMDN